VLRKSKLRVAEEIGIVAFSLVVCSGGGGGGERERE
jgi:hypothetical protein